MAWDGKTQDVPTFDHCALDAVNGGKAIDTSFQASGNGPLSFEGWVATPALKTPPAIVVLLLDAAGTNSWQKEGVAGVPREDVATALKSEALGNAGYKVDLAAGTVPAGRYSVLIAIDHNGLTHHCNTRMSVQVN